ncbi:hypothetical protein BFN03_00695 [Rhodococcus sp. WMMA185]|uniref:DUF1707 SHOCT-like domain-containing protein n=1 Tax=Rhodococcus sp. WMMA185 TaxID=679318 RepID=UPI000878CA47|nr:DUF1707 domain-containing protein [Rhodococcus sp. WMMA185]AOW91700.1 hypothetical protein BFN03_00695 [Rhodococcus sp. WMMA185]
MEARDLRVTDAEREHVGELLQRAVGQGMLSLGEFTERVDTALAAKTRGELNAVLADLPGLAMVSEFAPPPYPVSQHPVPQHPVPPYPAAQHPTAPHVAQPVPANVYMSPAPPPGDVIRGWMSSVSRTGPWNVPPVLELNTKLSTVSLDFTRAVMATQVVNIAIDDYGSTITLILPEEATVDLGGVETVGGTARNKVRTGPPIGPLHVVVRGKVRFGSVTARRSYSSAFRRMFG